MIVDYIDAHRDEFGVEPICNELQGRSEHVLRSPVPTAVG